MSRDFSFFTLALKYRANPDGISRFVANDVDAIEREIATEYVSKVECYEFYSVKPCIEDSK